MMTIDEAIQILNMYDLGNIFLDIDGNPIGYEKMSSACDMAVEALNALKQATCEDTISRQAAIDSLNEYFARIGKLKRRGLNKGEKAISLDTIGVIKTLPPVTPQQKTGKWQAVIPNDRGYTDTFRCSCCNAFTVMKGRLQYCDFDFCPWCGARMEAEDGNK